MRITSWILFPLCFSLLLSDSSPSHNFKITQPDGTSFMARMFGSEYYNYIHTEEGYAIETKIHDNEPWWFYAKKVNGKLVASEHKVGGGTKL